MTFLETPVTDLDKAWVVSPGIEGFVMFMVLALAGWFLVSSMTKHIRRANFRAAEREAELYGPPAATDRAQEAGGLPDGGQAEGEHSGAGQADSGDAVVEVTGSAPQP